MNRTAKPNRPAKSIFNAHLKQHWFAWVLALSLLIHIVGLIVAQPWARTTMQFDRQAEEERTQLVKQRELEREALERQRRQQVRLPRDQAEDLRRREELKHRDVLRENIRRLQAARERALQEREQTLEKLAQRTERDLVPRQLERLRQEVRKLQHEAHQVSREPQFGKKPHQMKGEISELMDQVEAMQQKASQDDNDLADTKEEAREIAEVVARLGGQYEQWEAESHSSAKGRTGRAANAARAAEKMAQQVAAGVDVAAMNDTAAAEPIAQIPQPVAEGLPPDTPPGELYDAAVELERQYAQADQHARGAELAVLQGTSLADGLKRVASSPPSRPDLSDALRAVEPGSDASVQTVGDLNAYRQAIATATAETTDMARRAGRQTDPARQAGSARQRVHADAAQAQRQAAMEQRARSGQRGQVIDLVPLQLGGGGNRLGGTGEGLRAASAGGGQMAMGTGDREVRLSGRQVSANALPGRMLTDDSDRQGFIYIDTWYIIGPWNNWARADFEIVHPPEQRVDLDAIYHDGKFADQPSHPDHKLRWQFVQSDQIAIQPPRIHHSATYYAYTEVYSDRTREMLVAVASDDMAKLWLNGDVVWADHGQSGWNLDEGFRRVIFRKGFNTLLVRIENGPTYCAFSVLLCPPQILD